MPSFSSRLFITSRLSPATKPVAPVVAVLVELNGVAQRRVLLRQLEKRELPCTEAAAPLRLLDGLDDGARVDALMDVERHRRHLEGGTCSALPAHCELRVQVRVVLVGLLTRIRIRLRRHQPDRRIVQPFLVPMVVGLNRPLGPRSSTRGIPPSSSSRVPAAPTKNQKPTTEN